jgi:hypothetical protein
MGYYARIKDTNFRIPADLMDKADATINALLEDEESSIQIHFYREVEGVKDALHELGFDSEINKDGDYVIYGFDAKWRRQDAVLDFLKGFVAADTYIDFIGEDGELCRWTTDGTKSAVITWV